jgi:carboxymethylenebutenolidase
MGSTIDLGGDGGASGYLAIADTGSGPGVIVVQEWWGLNDQIRATADRLAADGFVALAPDLYHGELAGHDEMDKAGQLMDALPAERAARDMSLAVDHLAELDATTGDGVGVVGFCMGGVLTMLLAAGRPDRIAAAVPFYGIPQGDDQPDYAPMNATIRGHMAANDDFFGPDVAIALQRRLQGMGKDVSFTIHDAGHAFMNETNALGTYDPELRARIWPEVVAFLHERLG